MKLPAALTLNQTDHPDQPQHNFTSRTTVVIAHRLSTVRNADLILVL